MVRKPSLKLVTDVPNSNWDWKSRYFFVQGLNWVCRPNEWDNIGEEYDNTWRILDEFGKSSVISSIRLYSLLYTDPSCFLFQSILTSILTLRLCVTISKDEEDFLQCILAIPPGEKSWKKLVMHDRL